MISAPLAPLPEPSQSEVPVSKPYPTYKSVCSTQVIDDVRDWCEENIPSDFVIHNRDAGSYWRFTVYIFNEESAMAFRLRWE